MAGGSYGSLPIYSILTGSNKLECPAFHMYQLVQHRGPPRIKAGFHFTTHSEKNTSKFRFFVYVATISFPSARFLNKSLHFIPNLSVGSVLDVNRQRRVEHGPFGAVVEVRLLDQEVLKITSNSVLDISITDG